MSKFSIKNVKAVKFVGLSNVFIKLFFFSIIDIIHAYINQNHANNQFEKKYEVIVLKNEWLRLILSSLIEFYSKFKVT